METQSPAKTPHHRYELDGWRGWAILLLLVGHFYPIAGINFGSVGVNFFFVLSGLLMGKILFVERVPINYFYRRRLSRILPTVLVFIATTILVFALFQRNIQWAEVLPAIFFMTNYFPGKPGGAEMPFGHIWSLCVEEHAYIFLGSLALAVRKGLIKATTAIAAGVCMTIVFGLAYWYFYRGPNLEFDLWIHSEVSSYGILVSCFLLVFFSSRKTAVPVYIVPVLLVLGLVVQWWSVPVPVRTFVGVGAFALAVNLLDQSPRIISSFFSIRPICSIGKWSFSIYLWQQPFYLAVRRDDMPAQLGVALALLTGIASFYLLENPARLYLNRMWQSMPYKLSQRSASM